MSEPTQNLSQEIASMRLNSGNSSSRWNDRLQSLTWSRVSTSAASCVPPPRSGAASVVVRGKLFMFGGYGGGTGRLDDFYSFDFDTKTWQEVTVLSEERPGCRENNGVVIGDSNRVYLFGGYNGSSWLNDLWSFDIDSQRWTCIQESTDTSRNHDAIRALGDHHNMISSSTSAISSSTTTSSSVRGRVPSRRFGYVSVVHGNKFILYGGFDGTRWLNDMHEFCFERKEWTEIQASGSLPSVRSCPAWAKDDTHVYIQGGYDGVERKADFFACDLSTYTWIEMPCLGTTPSPRYFHSCCLYGNKMYLYGGYSGSERLSDMYAYDFETHHWSEVDCTHGDPPSGRSSLVAQIYENCLYVFGGYNGSSVLNDFYKFRLSPVNILPTSLVSDLSKLVNNADLSDVSFLVQNQVVYCNKAILAVRSEYFRVMLFSGGMKETTITDAPIDINDVSHSVFMLVLEFLYTDTVRSEISLETGIHLLIASERFMLDRLKALCEDIIRKDVDESNAIEILLASHQHHATGLKDIALEFILRHLDDPSIELGLSDLKSEPDLLVEIIKRKSTAAPPGTPTATGGDGPGRDLIMTPPGPFGNRPDWQRR